MLKIFYFLVRAEVEFQGKLSEVRNFLKECRVGGSEVFQGDFRKLEAKLLAGTDSETLEIGTLGAL